jgi:hypothetical protein
MTFKEFLGYFPEVPPPFTITDESISKFKEVNDYLPEVGVHEHIHPWENEEVDEFTEYFPCLKLPSTDKYHALIYWKASILKYEYFLATLNPKGNLISKKVICGMVVESNVINTSAARIDEDRIIHIMIGSILDNETFDSSNTKAYNMEIMDDGNILFYME